MNFTVYKSSAGSGKTYTLVKEYLKIALSADNPDNYRHILAITFTNKAASEMKERIFQALKTLSAYSKETEKSSLLIDLLAELNVSEDIIRKRSEKVLSSMLHNYSDLSISTIDKFTHKIIRTFAHDLRLPVNFSVEMDGKKMLHEAIDLLISKVGTDDKLTRVLQDFVEKKADEEKNWEIESELASFSESLLKEEGIEFIRKLKHFNIDDFIEIRKKLHDFILEFEKSLAELGKKALSIISASGVPVESFAGGKNGFCAYFSYLANCRSEKFEPTPTVKGNFEKGKWQAAKCSKSDAPIIDSIMPSIQVIFNEAQKLVSDNLENHTLFSLIYKNVFSLSLLNEIEKLIEEIKKENNTIHISEFNKKISEIIVKEPAPFIYERLGERYHHFLIDEFQDTSILQWQNILPLIDNSLASGNFNMLVGDGKQSIYRWRGGEVEQFAKLPQVFNPTKNVLVKEREASLIRNYNEKLLDKNYRSKAEVIDFNNRFFKHISLALTPELQVIYDKHEQDFNPENTGGFVQIELIEQPDDEEISYKEIHCHKTLDAILQARNDGFSFKDITILTRANKDGAAIASFLIENEIPVISSESLLLGNYPDVRFLIAVLKYLNSPDHKANIAAITQHLFNVRIKNENLLHHTLYEVVKDKTDARFIQFLDRLDVRFDKDVLLKKPLYELSESLIRTFGLNSRPDIYIQFFLESVYLYSNKYDNNLKNFIEWWDERGKDKSVVIPQGLDAVNIMSVHKSKGLEFPVVIFPYADWMHKKSADNVWINLEHDEIPLKSALIPLNQQLEKTGFSGAYANESSKSILDNINVLYVALTRPECRLYIFSGKSKSNSVSEYFVSFLKSTGDWDENKTVYSYGSACRKKALAEKRKQVESYVPQTNISTDWHSKILISRQASKLWDIESNASSVKYGTLVHTALSRIKNAGELPAALGSMLSEGLITVSEKQLIGQKLNSLLEHPLIKDFYKEGLHVKNEAEILMDDGSIYRPDRVIISKNEAIVIDYKTGKETKSHHNQLNHYGNLLFQMGYNSVKKYLLYIEELRLEQINN